MAVMANAQLINLYKTGKTMECVDVTNVFSNGEYNFGIYHKVLLIVDVVWLKMNWYTSTESFTQRGGNALIMNTELTPNANT